MSALNYSMIYGKIFIIIFLLREIYHKDINIRKVHIISENKYFTHEVKSYFIIYRLW